MVERHVLQKWVNLVRYDNMWGRFSYPELFYAFRNVSSVDFSKDVIQEFLDYVDNKVDDVDINYNKRSGKGSGYFYIRLDNCVNSVEYYRKFVVDGFEDVYDRVVGMGRGPSCVVAAIEYLVNKDSLTQKDVYDAWNVTGVSLRSNKDTILEFFDEERFEEGGG